MIVRRTAASAVLLVCACAAGAQELPPGVPPESVPGDSKIADQAFASYAFATELGTGIYEIGGRTIQVYRLPLAIDGALGHDDWRWMIPITVGFYDFETEDVVTLDLPRGIGTFGVTPGLEMDYHLRDNWRVMPYVKAGFTLNSQNAPNQLLAGAGVHSLVTAERGPWELKYAEQLTYAIVGRRGLSADSLLRLRTGVSATKPTSVTIGRHQLLATPYSMLDYFLDAPEAPATGFKIPRSQLEVGLSFDLKPGPHWWIIPMPAVGIGYRFAGPLSGWLLALGAPF